MSLFARGTNRRFGKFSLLLGILVLLTLVLAACGGETPPTEVPPTPTVSTTYKVDNNPDLFFSISVLDTWTKQTNTSNSVSYQPGNIQNVGITISTSKITRLLPTSTELTDRRLRELKAQYSNISINTGEPLRLPDRDIVITEVKYNNGTDVTEYLGQVNIAKADRGYLLLGLVANAQIEKYKPIVRQSLSTMTFNPPEVTNQLSGTATPDATPVIDRGAVKVSPNAPTVAGKITTFVDWTTPALQPGASPSLSLTGKFPQLWNWGFKNFPTDNNPGIFFNSIKANAKDVVGLSSAEASFRLGVVQGAFSSDNPTAQDWTNVIAPYLIQFNEVIFPSIGGDVQTTNLTTDSTGLRKLTFNIRENNGGSINTRGSLYFRKINRDLLVATLFVGPDASIKDALVTNYDADLLTVVNSIRINVTK
jgi:hypothetical protein